MITVWITGDQCSPHNSALEGIERDDAVVLMIESIERSKMRRYHKRKLVLIFSAMRGFADDLRRKGWTVDYHAECADFQSAFTNHVHRYRPERVRTMAPSEYGMLAKMEATVAEHQLQIDSTPHCNFISEDSDYTRFFSKGSKRVTMESFYRHMRRKTGLLMEPDGSPAGDTWNLDAENRQPAPADMRFPPEPTLPRRKHVREAIAFVERAFPDHPGTIGDFDIPTTRADALSYAEDFFTHRFADFGPYEDAMLRDEARLFHSRLSAAINVGLLHPMELCRRAEDAYRVGQAPLQSAEGFIRQLLGWREFVWQTYWAHMPEYRTRNALHAKLPLPDLYVTGDTDMACMREALRWTHELGWAHHILRLMVLGNFGLIAGIEPVALNDWFWEMFVDGYDWVMVPNVIGMTLYADGGLIGTKPYAASGAYINRMSNYCNGCPYDPKASTGERACPFTTLYWDFIARHHATFSKNERMKLTVRNSERMAPDKQREIRATARRIIKALSGSHPTLDA